MLIGRRSIPPELRLSRDAVLSLVMHGLFSFAYASSMQFLNLYLWRLTESLWVNGVYNIIVYLMTALAFVVGGKVVKLKGKMSAIRFGIALFAVFYLAVLLAQENVLTYYPLFALFFGIANGIYWIGYWVLFYEVADDRNRLRFIGLQSVVMTTSNLTAPLLSGLIFVTAAGMTGYLVLFGISFVFFLAATFVSFVIRHAGSLRKSYYLAHMRLLMRKDNAYRKVTYGHLLYGLKQGVLLLLPPILLYQVLQGENFVGFFNAFASLLSVAASYLFSRYARERHIKSYIFFGSLVTTFGAVTLFFGLSVWTVGFFMVAMTMLNPLIQSSFDGYYYKLIGRLPLRGEMRVEALVVRELCWNIGRSITIFALIMLAEDLAGIWLTVIVSLTMAVPMLLLLLIEPTDDARKPQAGKSA